MNTISEINKLVALLEERGYSVVYEVLKEGEVKELSLITIEKGEDYIGELAYDDNCELYYLLVLINLIGYEDTERALSDTSNGVATDYAIDFIRNYRK